MSLERTFSAVVALLLLSGCAMTPPAPFTPEYNPNLIDGTPAFGYTIKAAQAQNILAASPEMVAFVDPANTLQKSEYSRFRGLMRRLVENDFFVDQYDASATYGAAETFAARKGNCVSYTTLFVALAREAGLNANFQLVRAKPTWNVESGYLIKNNHINVFVEDIAIPGYIVDGITVDFNVVRPDDDVDAEIITDAHATSLYFGNLAIDEIHKKDYPRAFAFLKRGILTEPANPDLWDNLGALYNIVGKPILAEQAYRVALQIDESDQTAIAGIARSLEHQGRVDAGQEYVAQATKYQQSNPYYHYAVAYHAFNNQLFDEALTAVSQAIELKKKSKFYALQAAVAKELGDEGLQQKSTRLQRKYLNRKPRRSSPVSYNYF